MKNTTKTKRAAGSDTTSITEAQNKLANIDVKIERLADALTDGLDRGVWKAKNEALNAEKRALQAQIASMRAARDAELNPPAPEEDDFYDLIDPSVHYTAEQAEARLQQMLKAWGPGGNPSLATKRKALANILNGGRVIVTFPPKSKDGKKPSGFALTFPAFGRLPATTYQVNADGSLRDADGDPGGTPDEATDKALPRRRRRGTLPSGPPTKSGSSRK